MSVGLVGRFQIRSGLCTGDSPEDIGFHISQIPDAIE